MIMLALKTLVPLMLLLAATGCGVTRTSDSKRTATEQLLVSSAIERAVTQIDCGPLSGRSVFLDAAIMDDANDEKYLVSTLRHQFLASGCFLAEKRETADVIVEVRAGAIGTDRCDLIMGMPGTNVTVQGHNVTTPDVAIAKRSEQRGVAKISLHAYERESGRPVWQSGMEMMASHARDRWLFGAGPFQDGELHDSPEFAGRRLEKTKWGWSQAKDYPEAVASAGSVDLATARVYPASAAGSEKVRDPKTVAETPAVELPLVR